MTIPKLSLWICCIGLAAASASAITTTELLKQLDQGAKITFMDVRANQLFQAGHLPGAINVPASVVPLKQFSNLGHIVVYDDGLGRPDSQLAAVALNRQPGISAEVLEGGFAAWEMAQPGTTKARGLQAESMPMITYDQLKKIEPGQAYLIDLRKQSSDTKKLAVTPNGSAITPDEPLTDLKSEFPGLVVHTSSFSLVQSARLSTKNSPLVPPLLVLIDNGDGTAQEEARALRANGHRRFVILAGGESILARQGQAGLQRSSSTMTFKKPTGTNSTTNR